MAIQTVLGIDIGGSGIKGAIVDVERGVFVGERFRLPTPQPAAPAPVGQVVAELARHFQWRGPIGCTFPAVIKAGVAYTAANVDAAWINTDVQALLEAQTGCPVAVLNDGDAAGLAEMAFGAARGRSGVVLLLTFGTGIGSALLVDGRLVPNTELGHLEIHRRKAEALASDRVRKQQHLSWTRWAKRLDMVIKHMERLFAPDLFIIGGGVSKDHAQFLPL
jgi:polyphosphate glucokinase